ncbi:MAG: hypothetical protein CMI54_06245 [Parcubacteria group bacterium]|jgi:hypothetical protein|nr:hypothetical protein [Parcubacteria group bacterium]|tara:strand:- start:18949 stop:19149 length:201 start_codon:yes stop_codon:yes gene_type:complete
MSEREVSKLEVVIIKKNARIKELKDLILEADEIEEKMGFLGKLWAEADKIKELRRDNSNQEKLKLD